MPNVSPSVAAFQMRDALYDIFKAEMTPSGRLASLQSITKSAQFSTEKVPALGVMIAKGTVSDAWIRAREYTVTLEIVLAAKSTRGVKVANLEDAMETLRPLIDDGATNGIIPILNSRSSFGLNGTATESVLGDFEWLHDVNEGAEQSVWAYYLQRYHAKTIVSF